MLSPREGDGGDGGAHAPHVRVLAGLGEDGGVGRLHRLVEARAPPAKAVLQRLDGGGAGHLAGPVAAHPVGHGVEAGAQGRPGRRPRWPAGPDRRRCRAPTLGGVSYDDLEDGLADLEPVAPAQRHGLGQPVAVEEGAVGGAEVLHEGLPVPDVDAGVELRDERVVGQGTLAARRPADRDLLAEGKICAGGRAPPSSALGASPGRRPSGPRAGRGAGAGARRSPPLGTAPARRPAGPGPRTGRAARGSRT